jgi:hypothetical protein
MDDSRSIVPAAQPSPHNHLLERVPDKLANTAARLIAAAVSLLGSSEEVRAHMRASKDQFLEYCAGSKEPSFGELDRLVTLIVREQGKIIAQNRELLQRARERPVHRNSRRP